MDTPAATSGIGHLYEQKFGPDRTVSDVSSWLVGGKNPQASRTAMVFADLLQERTPASEASDKRLLGCALRLINTRNDGRELSREALLLTWRLKVYLPFWLETMNMPGIADMLTGLPEIDSFKNLEEARRDVGLVNANFRQHYSTSSFDDPARRYITAAIRPTNWVTIRTQDWFFPQGPGPAYTGPDLEQLQYSALDLAEAMLVDM